MDLRDNGKPFNETTDDQINDVKNHIESFPTVDSHYFRKQSSGKYLSTSKCMNCM